jgi:hypothetical protein
MRDGKAHRTDGEHGSCRGETIVALSEENLHPG